MERYFGELKYSVKSLQNFRGALKILKILRIIEPTVTINYKLSCLAIV